MIFNEIMYNNILVPHAGTPAGDQALKHAIHAAKGTKAKIILLHVVEEMQHPPTFALSSSERDKLLKNIKDANEDIRKGMVPEFEKREKILETLDDDVRQGLASIPTDNLELQMDYLRRFKHAQILHVAASDITGQLPLVQVSDRLTDIAESMIHQVQYIAFDSLQTRFGCPPHYEAGADNEFAVIAYGKGGVLETVHPLNPISPKTESSPPTGVFFYEQTIQALTNAIQLFRNSAHSVSADGLLGWSCLVFGKRTSAIPVG